jgi:LemA protein
MNILFGLIMLALVGSGLFNIVPWSFNIPAIAVLFVIWLVMMYNSLVTLTQRVKNAWADIDVQLKRRYDLIPNLVNTVKGSSNFETSTLEKVIQARGLAMGAGTMAEHKEAENMLTGALKSVFALAESYPDLKSNQNYLALQNELSDTENKIQAARRFYNSNVMEYNTLISMVPSNIIAKMFSFGEKEFFELTEGEQAAKEPVEVKF